MAPSIVPVPPADVLFSSHSHPIAESTRSTPAYFVDLAILLSGAEASGGLTAVTEWKKLSPGWDVHRVLWACGFETLAGGRLSC
jgi:hypothetical protein